MKLVITVAAYEAGNLHAFLNRFPLNKLRYNDTLLIVGTGESTPNDTLKSTVCIAKDIARNKSLDYDFIPDIRYASIPPMPRRYASVMYEKIRICEEEGLSDDNTILFNCDDDYHYNPHAFELARRAFEHFKDMDYLSLLRGPGIDENKVETVPFGGLTLAKLGTCMGGSMVARWSKFRPTVKRFFKGFGVNGEVAGKAGMFGVEYWKFLHPHIQNKTPVWTLMDFSLVQQCNTISYFVKEKKSKGPLQHMYGVNYDPVCDPFKLSDAMLKWRAE